MNKKRFSLIVTLAVAILAITSIASGTTAIGQTSATPPGEVHGSPQYSGLDLVRTTPGFSIFVAAMESTGLAAIARQQGPYTLLAPTDEAFMRLPEGERAAIMSHPDRLRAILEYHIVPGVVESDRIHNERMIDTVEGDPILFRRTATGVLTANAANVTQRDIQSANGLVQVIDSVLIPNRRTPPDQTRDTTQ
ncbi:MAG: fasciclin domain-containing protein [Candidatus Eremiobacteraeota bacterium]|nr:fasciclin domain-containing protein [Candidatus Eremiobacteraeota bacterium]MBV8354194.1 fasciclin domain-containing protein [Candidatus Eremiobacteraeota bacterium]